MKILFVENRYATWLYADVAHGLRSRGHEIHWLVQNRLFAPRFGKVHYLEPKPGNSVFPTRGNYDWLMKIDRAVQHFGVVGDHYEWFDARIDEVLRLVSPGVVIGESTQFHELLTIERCKLLGIPFRFPTATRFPPERMQFFADDTMCPVGGSGQELSASDAAEIASAIAESRIKPFTNAYAFDMHPPSVLERIKRGAEPLRLILSWALGERYVTPSPSRKAQLGLRTQRARARWDWRASADWRSRVAGRPWVLFPMQMQPETNLDVWGRPWTDQAEIIRRAAKSLLAIGGALVVKPNPTSKYELLQEALFSAIGLENVVAVPHRCRMSEIFPRAPWVLAVTGTVQMECLFARKPVAVLGEHEMSKYPGITRIDSPDDLGRVVDLSMVNNRAKTESMIASGDDLSELVRHLYRTSYPAIWFDPLSSPQYSHPQNIAALVDAFSDQLRAIASRVAPAPAAATR